MAKPSGAVLNSCSFLTLRTFVAVAEAKSFSAAARQLRIAASAATNHVLAIERSLGIALFHRTTRRVAITPAGEEVYQKCRLILSEIDGLATNLAPSVVQTGHVRVTAPPSFALTALGPNLSKFLARYPGITVDLMVTSSVPNMISERIDVTFVLREDLDGKLPHLRLATTNRAFCASAHYLDRCGTPQSPADLKKHSCLANVVMGVPERWSVLMGRTKRELKLDSRLLADNGEILRRACLDGAGIGNFYRFHVREDLRTGRLIEVLEGFQPNTNALYAILPHRQIILPHVDVFIKFVGSVVLDPPFRQKDGDWS